MKANKEDLKEYGYYLQSLSASHSVFTVFDDFLTMIVCSLSMQRKEEEYLKTVGKYTKEEVDLFCKAYASLILQMENNPLNDPFGGYFEEYLYNERNGQFFTPQTVSDFMAQITMTGGEVGNKVNDPACGSGRLFLSVAKIDRKKYFVGSDIDLMCCKMTLINLCFNSLQGEVYHMNTLSLEIWRTWFVFVDPVLKIPYIYEVENEESTPSAIVEPVIQATKKEVENVIQQISLLETNNTQGKGFVRFKAKA